ncbi:MAG: sulfatase, partial [Candidatus Coatesbacteria bacterium]
WEILWYYEFFWDHIFTAIVFLHLLGIVLILVIKSICNAVMHDWKKPVPRTSFFWICIIAAAMIVVTAVIAIGFVWDARSRIGIERESPGAPNVLIITIDALREDYVSYPGYDFVETPNIDAFASKAILYSDCHSNSPWTIPSMFTMLTSRYPSTHGAHFTVRGSDELITLAEVLRMNGYETEAYVANTVLDGELGFDRGFSRYVRFEDIPHLMWLSKSSVYFIMESFRDHMAQWGHLQTTPWLTRILCNALKKERRRPFFIWAHYFDPHLPLTPPERYIWGDRSSKEEALSFIDNHPRNITPEYKGIAVPLYGSEVLYVDDYLARVFGVLEDEYLFENTLIIISADHGEEHFDHGYYGHGETHYEEVLAVPMLLYTPDLPPGRCDYPVSLIDVMPTILEYVGTEAVEGGKGRNMLDYLNKEPIIPDDTVVYAEGTISDLSTRSVYIYPYILIREGDDPFEYEMEDVRLARGPGDILEDPDEALFEKYRKTLDDLAVSAADEAESVGGRREIPLSEGRREQLKNLGYFQ